MPGKERSGRDLSPEQNEALRPLVREAIARLGSQIALERVIGWDQASISGFLSERQGTSFAVAIQICELVGRDVSEVLGLKVTRTLGARQNLDMPVGTFLLKLSDYAGLKSWVQEHPQEVKISDVVHGIQVLESGRAGSYARTGDLRPHEGWDKFFSDLRAGKFDGAARATGSDIADVRAAEAREIGEAPKTIDIPPPKSKRRSR